MQMQGVTGEGTALICLIKTHIQWAEKIWKSVINIVVMLGWNFFSSNKSILASEENELHFFPQILAHYDLSSFDVGM